MFYKTGTSSPCHGQHHSNSYGDGAEPVLSSKSCRKRKRQRGKKSSSTGSSSSSSSELWSATCTGHGRKIDEQWSVDISNRLTEHQRDTPEENQAIRDSLRELAGRVWEASTDEHGCRVVQTLLEKCSKEDWPLLLDELNETVWLATHHKHANFIVAKNIEVVLRKDHGFIIEACIGRGSELARGQAGCRIFCRIIEHNHDSLPNDEQTNALISEVLQCAPSLCCHRYACHVVNSILEYGQPDQQEQIMAVLCEQVMEMATDRHASFVVEAALNHCSCDDKARLQALLRKPEHIKHMATSQFGWHVVASLAQDENEASVQNEEEQESMIDDSDAQEEDKEDKEDKEAKEGGQGKQAEGAKRATEVSEHRGEATWKCRHHCSSSGSGSSNIADLGGSKMPSSGCVLVEDVDPLDAFDVDIEGEPSLLMDVKGILQQCKDMLMCNKHGKMLWEKVFGPCTNHEDRPAYTEDADGMKCTLPQKLSLDILQ